MTNDHSARAGSITSKAVQSLKKLLDELRAKPLSQSEEEWNLGQIVAAKSAVITRFGQAFSSTNVGKLTRETFREFLRFENNRHWRGLTRSGAKITDDMNRLKEALTMLVDESKAMRDRLARLYPGVGKGMVPFLGPAILTAILHVVYPERYGVFNNTRSSVITTPSPTWCRTGSSRST